MAGTARIGIEITAEAQQASKELQSFGSQIEKTAANLKTLVKPLAAIGAGAMAMGGAILAGAAMCVKAFDEERQGIMRLVSVMGNIGTAYDEVSASLEENIATLQRKTGVADEQQREVLSRLIVVTQDYNAALNLLPTALDLAAATGMDAATAALYLGRVIEGDVNALSRYGIKIAEGTSATKALAEIQERVAGTAEAMVSPFDQITNSVDDLKEAIGAELYPTLQNLANIFIPIVTNITEWIKQNPELVRTVVQIGGAIATFGAILVGLATIIWVANTALAAFRALCGDPTGLIILGVAAAAGIASFVGLKKVMDDATDSLKIYQDTAAQTPTPGQTRSTRRVTITTPADLLLPEYQHGGIVPGPKGTPVPILAHAGEVVSNEGTNAPQISINVEGSVITERQFIDVVREALYNISRYNVNTGVT